MNITIAGLNDVEIDGAGQSYGLVKPRSRPAIGRRRARGRPAQHRLDDECAAGRRARRAQTVGVRVATARLQSDLFPGRRIFGALEQLHRMSRHDGRDSVLVDELRMAIATQQHAEIIEPGHHALQLDAVHQKNGERNFALADVIEEGVLQGFVRGRLPWPLFPLFVPQVPPRGSFLRARWPGRFGISRTCHGRDAEPRASVTSPAVQPVVRRHPPAGSSLLEAVAHASPSFEDENIKRSPKRP